MLTSWTLTTFWGKKALVRFKHSSSIWAWQHRWSHGLLVSTHALDEFLLYFPNCQCVLLLFHSDIKVLYLKKDDHHWHWIAASRSPPSTSEVECPLRTDGSYFSLPMGPLCVSVFMVEYRDLGTSTVVGVSDMKCCRMVWIKLPPWICTLRLITWGQPGLTDNPLYCLQALGWQSSNQPRCFFAR